MTSYTGYCRRIWTKAIAMSKAKRCPGCGQETEHMDVVLTMVDRGAGRDWHSAFCTPRCAYDWWREVLDAEYGQNVEPDLLAVVAEDIFKAVSDLGSPEDITQERFDEIVECWARLGHVLGLLNVTLPEAE